MTRRVRTRFGDRLYAIEIEAGLAGTAEFATWRIALHNLVDHARRDGPRWWREFGFVGWLTRDGRIRGVVALGSLTPDEVEEKLRRRWPTKLRRIEPADLRREIEAVVEPGMIASTGGRGGYQAVKLAIYPRQAIRSRAGVSSSAPARRSHDREPLPILF